MQLALRTAPLSLCFLLFASSCGSDSGPSARGPDPYAGDLRITDRDLAHLSLDLLDDQAGATSGEPAGNQDALEEPEEAASTGEEDLPINYCLEYTGSDTCCQTHNPCNLANNSQCDCDGLCGWDGSDCSGSTDAFCPGYTGSDTCCRESDPCWLSYDYYCDCDGACSWDSYDCGGGSSGGEYCPGYTGTSSCCQVHDPCNYANDDWCDCDGACSWDTNDCSGQSDPEEGEFCPGYTGTSSCCQVHDPCAWANDNYCDCSGTCSWDSYDCY
ncbi:MAG: hypothetical protein JW797_18660 [Bradymonadales bacterium]|nr:hypothetical protein [Bradymonadales bacterium]